MGDERVGEGLGWVVFMDPDWTATYAARAAENLASAQYLLLGRLVRVLVVGEVEAGRAAGILALLQRWRVPLVHALQGAPPDTPIEVVHAFPLRDVREHNSETERKIGSWLYKCMTLTDTNRAFHYDTNTRETNKIKMK